MVGNYFFKKHKKTLNYTVFAFRLRGTVLSRSGPSTCYQRYPHGKFRGSSARPVFPIGMPIRADFYASCCTPMNQVCQIHESRVQSCQWPLVALLTPMRCILFHSGSRSAPCFSSTVVSLANLGLAHIGTAKEA